MSLHVNKRKRKDGSAYWRLLRSIWKDNKRTWEHVPVSQLLQWGMSPEMTVDEAIERAAQLNAQAKLDKPAEIAKAGALRSRKKHLTQVSAHLPARFVAEFETDYLRKEMERGTNPGYSYKKALSQWEHVKRLIVTVGLPQEHWFQHKRRFYTEFAKKELCPDYAGKLLRVLNLWGVFIALKTKTSFIQVPRPKGFDAQAIRSAHADSGKRKKDSLPLTPALLQKAKGKLKEGQWNWLFVSLWFGLRATEISGKWRVTGTPGRQVLEVYQSKLVGIDPQKRWKFIPAKYPEQRAALKLLVAGDIERPWPKTIQAAIGPGYNTHAGRKGFTGLMQDLQEPFDIVSDWLGHQDIRITHEAYRDKTRVKWGRVS